MELPAFTGVPSPLTMPITPVEVQRAISKLNSGRACGHDDLPADLLKSTADLIAPSIATIFNDALEHHEPLDIGKGVLIFLQKLGKPVGPLTSVRPIVLLPALRKTLSLIVLSRIATKVDNFLSPSQSCSGEDVVRQTLCLATDGFALKRNVSALLSNFSAST